MCFQIHCQITILVKDEILLPFEGLSADGNSYGLFLTFCDHLVLLFFRQGYQGKELSDRQE